MVNFKPKRAAVALRGFFARLSCSFLLIVLLRVSI